MDVLITSSSRVECLEKTMETFIKYVKYSGDFRIILHEDFVIKKDSEDVVRWAEKQGYFSKIIQTQPAQRIGKAIESLMNECTDELALKWEDDWEFTKEVNLDNVIRIFNEHKDVNQIMFNKKMNPAVRQGFNHKEVVMNDQTLTLCREWGMAPAVWRISWIKPRWKCYKNGDAVNKDLMGGVFRNEEWCKKNLGAYWYESPGEGKFVNHLGYGGKNDSKLKTVIDN